MQEDKSFFNEPLGSSFDYLKSFGFSSKMIEHFWKPFFSGIFLEPDLKTEAAYFRFLFKMFSLSPVAVPANGMGELPKSLFAKLKNTKLRLNTEVLEVSSGQVRLANGELVQGTVIDTRPNLNCEWGSVSTLYFAADKSPVSGPWLVLNSKSNNRFVNHVAVMSEVSRSYAPKGDALISVNLILPKLTEALLLKVRSELVEMFGAQVNGWRFLKSFEIPKALPLYLTLPNGELRFATPSQQGSFLRAKQLLQSSVGKSSEISRGPSF
jgi:hypothetical protein